MTPALPFSAVIILVLLEPAQVHSTCDSVYHWRDYARLLPYDAFEVCQDSSSNPIYVASVHYKKTDEIIPGTLIPDVSNSVKVAYHARVQQKSDDANTRIEVLCSSDSDRFEWISTNNNDLASVVRTHHLITGGYTHGKNLYYGRVKRNGGYVVGKVFPAGSHFKGLWIPDGWTVRNFDSYEVLACDCLEVDIDLRE